MSPPLVTAPELARNNGEHGRPLWVAINGDVYDLSSFANLHPGGKAILLRHAGNDASKLFKLFHNELVLSRYKSKLQIVGTTLPAATAAQDSSPRESSRSPSGVGVGSQIPYADPFWYQRSSASPYFKASHFALRNRLRALVDNELLPNLADWAESSRPPEAVMRRLGETGVLALMTGGPPFPVQYLDPGTPSVEDYDFFHCNIVFDELARLGGNAGVVAAITNGPAIACSSLLRYGSEELKRRILPDVLMGRKMIALGVSEPGAGSDVSGLTTALCDDGEGYVRIDGTKKWITNGMYADYITLLAKDANAGGAFSIVIVPTDAQGFTARKVNVRDSNVSGTSLLDLVGVRVPKTNIVGKRGQGWPMQMASFNFERMYLVCVAIRLSRILIEECIKYALKRETFGVPLYQHQAIRMRIAEMIRDVEGVQAWADSITFQMNVLEHAKAQALLGDVIASIKVQASLVYERCARHALHVFGGNALQAKGVGHLVEPALLQTKGYLIPAGSADVMDDFVARQAFKLAKQVVGAEGARL